MPQSFSQRRRAEHARRRREEAERIAGDGPVSDRVKEIKEMRGSSQLAELPGETFEDIFSVSDQATIGEDQRPEVGGRVGGSYAEEGAEEQRRSSNSGTSARSSVEDRSLPDRTPEEQERLVRAIIRKFNAREVETDEAEAWRRDHARADGSYDEEMFGKPEERSEKCTLCRRDSTRRSTSDDGRKWCQGADADSCIRIAQGRLGGATAPGRASLSGKLKADGDCRRCGQPVKWVKTQRGKKMPVNVEPAPGGVAAFELIGQVNTLAFYVSEKKRPTFAGDVYESHFQTCEAGE